jgi:hypothetical protein
MSRILDFQDLIPMPKCALPTPAMTYRVNIAHKDLRLGSDEPRQFSHQTSQVFQVSGDEGTKRQVYGSRKDRNLTAIRPQKPASQRSFLQCSIQHL